MSDPKYTMVEYVAANRFAVSNAAQDSFVAEFPVGLRVQADCGSDGIRLGSVTAAAHDAGAGRTLVDALLDSGTALTGNLTAVLHGCVDPDALCGHTHDGQAQGGDLPAYVKVDCSVPFNGGHIPAAGDYTGFKFTETGTDVAADAAKSIVQVDNGQVSLLFVNDAETIFNAVWTADRIGAAPSYFTINPSVICAGGLTTNVLNGEDISAGIPFPMISKAAAATPGQYSRDVRWLAKTVSVAADRHTLLSPNAMGVNVGGSGLHLAAQQALDLSQAATWDSVGTDYRVAANRAGKNFYVYAVLVGGVALGLLASANATCPTGYSTTTSRKIGGFHCLCLSVGTISGHALSGYVTGDILPASVWDLKHRPVSAPEGMVYVAGIGKWVDIYLASVSAGALTSAYNATCADGASATVFDWYDFSEWFGRIGKRLPTQAEFMAAATGSNEGTNIAGSADPGTTGGKTDTAGRRMISSAGVEDCAGNLFQWSIEAGAVAGTAALKDQFVSGRTTQRGQGYQEPTRGILGGVWSNGAYCGSRGSVWNNGPTTTSSGNGARGVSDAIEEI